VNEQVEEEALFAGIVDRMKSGGNAGLLFLDKELHMRK
jgi:ferritin